MANGKTQAVDQLLKEGEQHLDTINSGKESKNNLEALKAAVEAFREAVTIAPENTVARKSFARALSHLGVACGRVGKPHEAIAALKEAILHEKTDARLYNNLAVALSSCGDWQGAADQHRAALRMCGWRPDDPVVAGTAPMLGEIHRNLGLALCMLPDLDAARIHFAEAVRQRPQDVDTHCLLATVLKELHRLPEAARAYMEVLRLQPGHARARKGLEQVRSLLKASQEQEQKAARATAVEEESSSGLGRLASFFCQPNLKCCADSHLPPPT